jgi:hypothetical protein
MSTWRRSMSHVNDNDDAAGYWDDYFNDFGLDAYIQARYVEGLAHMDQAKDGKASIIYSDVYPCGMCGEVHPV